MPIPLKKFHPSFLILAAIFVVFATFVILSMREKQLADPNNANWWSLQFATREETNGTFSVANFGETRSFSYEVTSNGTSVETGSFTIGPGNGQTILAERDLALPITVSVWTDGDENKKSSDLEKRKVIYRK